MPHCGTVLLSVDGSRQASSVSLSVLFATPDSQSTHHAPPIHSAGKSLTDLQYAPHSSHSRSLVNVIVTRSERSTVPHVKETMCHLIVYLTLRNPVCPFFSITLLVERIRKGESSGNLSQAMRRIGQPQPPISSFQRGSWPRGHF